MNNLAIGVTLDCVDVKVAAAFWKEALGYDEPHPYVEGAQFHGLASRRGGLDHLTLQLVDEPKSGKNRVHLDLLVDDLDSEAARLSQLGARVVQEHNDEDGPRSAVLADPLGNEFCLVER